MPRRKKTEEPVEEVKTIKTPPLIKGMKDVVPADYKYWGVILDSMRNVAHDFRFTWVDTPLLEKYDLYAHTYGRTSAIIKKDLFYFLDRNEKVALRFDHTPAVARSYISHGLFNKLPPNKYWYNGNVYTRGKEIESKNREHREVGFEVYGEKSAAIDAELIMLMYQSMVSLGLNPVVRLNSLGCLACRSEYSKALTGFIKSKRGAVCTECRSKATKDPLSFLSCASQKCSRVLDDAPQSVDYLCEDCHSHLFKLLESLDELEVQYTLDSRMVRGVDYYNSTIYEVYHKPVPRKKGDGDEEGKESEEEKKESDTKKKKDEAPTKFGHLVAEGGRFNYLVEMLSGPETPAAGIKFYVEKMISVMKEQHVEIPKERPPHVYLAQLSEQAKRSAMGFIQELRREDLRVVANFSKDSLKSQLGAAKKMGARILLILGQREVVDGTIIMRDVESGIQEVINRDKAISEVKKKIYAQK